VALVIAPLLAPEETQSSTTGKSDVKSKTETVSKASVDAIKTVE
jgi:hypothetical protein